MMISCGRIMASEKLKKKSRGEDIISKLPDDVLINILSRLETKVAVRTCVLSSRWKNLWTYIYNFYFDDGEDDRCGRSPNFENFVDSVLSRCLSRDVQDFYLDCTIISDDELSRVVPWISSAVERKVRNLNIKVDIDWYGDWLVRLPQSILTCSSLVELSILSDFIFDIPDSVVCFPSLKLLGISIKHPDGVLMQKLFSNCPVLEDLSIYGSKFDNEEVVTFNIKVPTLKMLRIWLGMDYCSSKGVSKHKFVVTARNLEYLHIDDYTLSSFLVNERPFLDVASLNVSVLSLINEMDELEVNRVMELLRGIDCTKTLSLTSCTMDLIGWAINDNMPTFTNLIHLELGIKACFGWKLLPHFLDSSPNLEVLILQMDHKTKCTLDSFVPFESENVPSCLRLHIKEIEIINMKEKYDEPKLVNYLLRNSEVLEKLLVNIANSKSKKYLQRQILKYSRGSAACEIEFI
ncbi:hypothetical protein ACOSP7_029091 [Xanthoceras sorbifolium]